MIYDIIDNIEQYTGMFENLDIAINYIANNDLSALPLGRTDIDGDNVFVKIVEINPKQTQDLHFETHSVYMDLQLDIDGMEICEVAHGELEEFESYDEEKDMALYNGEPSCAFLLTPERFALFMVEQAHKTGVKSECDIVKKAIFKIAYNRI